jgi:2-methylcitrate dehydratase
LTLARELGEYVRTVRYRDLGSETVREIKRRIVDSLGCAIGAFDARPVRIARQVAGNMKAVRGATIMGTQNKVSPDVATFVNGMMIRYFDYNDTYLSKEPAHPSDNLSACMAVAEAEESSGKDLLTAAALAYELQCRLCDAADIRHRGWDHVCYGLVSSSLAAGKLMGLTAEKLEHSVNIALNSHIAMRQVRAGELSEWKGASFANAARNAVFSATLAGGGMTGPSPIFEGEMGFFKQVSGPFRLDIESFGGGRGRFKILDTYIKYFPAEYHSQSAIWAALEVRKEIDGRPNEIQSVLVETHEAGYTILGKDMEKWTPETKETADHSLPFIVGVALLEGRIDNGSYSGRKIRDPRIRAFLKKIVVKEDPELTTLYPASIANRVTVVTSSGRKVSRQVNDPRGHPKNPMTDEEIESKFLSLTGRFLTEEQAREVLGYVWRLERKGEISGLARALSALRKPR